MIFSTTQSSQETALSPQKPNSIKTNLMISPSFKQYFDHETQDFMTALHVVCRSGFRYDDAKIMVEMLPTLVSQPTPKGGDTPLHFAVASDDLPTVQLFLNVNPSAALIQSTRSGFFGSRTTPLHVALCHGARLEIIEALVSACPRSLKIRNGEGRSPQHLARKFYKGERLEPIIECLLRHA